MSEQHESAWRKSLDDYKTRSDDPGRVTRSRPAQYRCLECGWQGHGVMARFNHYQQTGGHRIIMRPTKVRAQEAEQYPMT